MLGINKIKRNRTVVIFFIKNYVISGLNFKPIYDFNLKKTLFGIIIFNV